MCSLYTYKFHGPTQVFLDGIAVEGAKLSKIKLTFAMIACIIGVHDCLNLSKIFASCVVCDHFNIGTKSLKVSEVGVAGT